MCTNDDVKYGVIHEVGEYAEVKPLSEEDNKTVNDAEKEKKDKK